MPSNSNKYAEGIEWMSPPSNLGSLGKCNYEFPESLAQDSANSNMYFTFSGTYPGGGSPFGGSTLYSAGWGPSGFRSPKLLTALRFPASSTAGVYMPHVFAPASLGRGPAISTSVMASRGAPDLLFTYLSNFAWSAASDPNRIASMTGYQYSGNWKHYYWNRAINSINNIAVLDLVSEGPLEGFVSGTYTYNTVGKTTGDIGYTSAIFSPYTINSSLLQWNPAAARTEARSILWDDVPLVDFNGYVNFQQIDYKYTLGYPNNDHTVYNPNIFLYEQRYDWFGAQTDIQKYPIKTSRTRALGDKLYGASTNASGLVFTYPKTYFIYNTDIDQIKINLRLDSLYEVDITGGEAGDYERTQMFWNTVVYRVFKDGSLIELDGEKFQPFSKPYYSRHTVELMGKISSGPFLFTQTINLRPFAENKPNFPIFQNQVGWAIDITKRMSEGLGAASQNKTVVDSITEVYSDRFTYPNSALILSRFDARYFSQVPSRAYNLRLLKVKIPNNYDPILRTYNGAWNGKFKVAWTDNPAWCFYDMVTNNRFGLGRYIDSSLVDKWTLYEISQYCDQLVPDGNGGLEPRFSCNLLINTREEAYKVLNDIASIFNGIIYYSAGQLYCSQDRPRDPIYLFNNTNVVNGTFTYSDSSKRVRRTVAQVRYNDKNNFYKPSIEYIEDRNGLIKYGFRPVDVTAFGCVTKNQARRAGKWFLATENKETEMVQFDAGLEGSFLRPGDVISIYDQDRADDVYGGRAMDLDAGSITTDVVYNGLNLLSLTGYASGLELNIVTPTYNLNLGTALGDLYATGYPSQLSGEYINTNFLRRSQVQKIYFSQSDLIKNITTGSQNFSGLVKINFKDMLNPVSKFTTRTPGYINITNNNIKKINSDQRWDAAAYSNDGFISPIFLEAKANQINGHIIFGLDEDPARTEEYTNISYGWYFKPSGILQISTDGNLHTSPSLGTYDVNTRLAITYDGSTIRYWKNNSFVSGTARNSANGPLYFDSAFYNTGAGINITFGTSGLSSLYYNLPKNTIWAFDLNPSGYGFSGINTRSKINNNSLLNYPGSNLEGSLNKVNLYRVVSCAENENSIYSISAIQYTPSKYLDIDSTSLLINQQVRPPLASTPNVTLSILYRNSAGGLAPPTGYSSYQPNGINSIIYRIANNSDSNIVSYYDVYIKRGSDFIYSNRELSSEISYRSILRPSELVTGINYSTSLFPPYVTPSVASTVWFRAYAINYIGERSLPFNGNLTISAQASSVTDYDPII